MLDQAKTAPTLEKLREKRAEILALAEKYGAYNVRVFGSVVRGDTHPDSDVDFFVNFREGTSLYDLSGLWQDLQELLGCSVDIVSDHQGLKERFRKRIADDLVEL